MDFIFDCSNILLLTLKIVNQAGQVDKTSDPEPEVMDSNPAALKLKVLPTRWLLIFSLYSRQ